MKCVVIGKRSAAIGAVLGYAIGKMVVRNHNRHLQIVPAITPNEMGLSLSYQFE